MRYTITYSRTIPKGEGKFGSFEKMEVTREFDSSIPESVAGAMCKTFVLGQLGLHAEADAQLNQVFIEQRNFREDLDVELRRQENNPNLIRADDLGQIRAYLIGMGFDISDVVRAERAAVRP